MSRIKNVLEYLEHSALAHADKRAAADETEACTYAQLRERAMRAGTRIAQAVPPRTPVAVLGTKGVQTLAMFLGCVYAGCFYVPLNPLHPLARRESILRTLGSPLILVQDGCERLLPPAAENVLLYSQCGAAADEALLRGIRAGHIDADPLYVLFTSGSTGEPKGIAVPHRAVIDFIEEFTDAFGFGADEVFGNQAPFDFDVSVKDIYSCLKCGATLEIIPKAKFSFPQPLLDYLCERKVTTLVWAVSALCILSGYRAFEYKVPERVRNVLFSGDAMPVNHLNEWKRRLPHARFVNLYGPTEITCNCTYYVLGEGEFAGSAVPIGRPFPNERVFLLDEEGNAVTEANRQGEICVSGTSVSAGYYRNAEQTSRAFVQNPLNPAYLETVYRTGDIGYRDENGDLCFVGRKDFQIKHMGHRIELGEIEAALQGEGGVERAVCLYDAPSEKIWAFCHGGESAAAAKALRRKLPPYMVPHRFVHLPALPLTANGKIDRKKLREEYMT